MMNIYLALFISFVMLVMGFVLGFLLRPYVAFNKDEEVLNDEVTDLDEELEEVPITTRDLYTQIESLLVSQADMKEDIKSIFESYQNPINQGPEGENVLRLIFENSGMVEDVQFFHNRNLPEGDGRPDYKVLLPGNGAVYVDAKFLTRNFTKAYETEDEYEKEKLFQMSADDVWTAAKGLANRDYTKFDGYNSPNFIFMFLPTDNIYANAVSRKPDLLEKCNNGFAAKGKVGTPVIPITPTAINAALRTITMLWRERNMYENISSVKTALNHLHTGLEKFNSKFILGGKALLTASHEFRIAFSDYVKIKPQVKEIENVIHREDIKFSSENDFMKNKENKKELAIEDIKKLSENDHE